MGSVAAAGDGVAVVVVAVETNLQCSSEIIASE